MGNILYLYIPMNDKTPGEEYYAAPIELIIVDGTLPLVEVQDFVSDYTVRFGQDVRIVSRWGGPAAGGIGWGGPEIAVMIVLGELLRRTTSDAYQAVKLFLKDAYKKIRTKTGAHWYVGGVFALVMDSQSGDTRVMFCFAEGMTSEELETRIKLVEQHAEAVVRRWESRARQEVKVCWSEAEEQWVECEPAPEWYINPRA